MVVARITFKPEYAPMFLDANRDGTQPLVTEVLFETPEALIEQLKSMENAIAGCCAITNGEAIYLQPVR